MSVGVSTHANHGELYRYVKVLVNSSERFNRVFWNGNRIFCCRGDRLMKFFNSRWGLKNRFTERAPYSRIWLTSST